MKGTEAPIEVAQLFNCSINKLWNALTSADEMRQWFFPQMKSFEAREGFNCSFDVNSEDVIFVHNWNVIEVRPNEKLVIEWNYKGIVGNSHVIFEIEGKETASALKLSHIVIEDFLSDLPQFTRESGVAGWEYLIEERLKNFLEASEA